MPDYDHRSRFTGQVNWVAIETSDDDHTHLLSAEQQLQYQLAQH